MNRRTLQVLVTGAGVLAAAGFGYWIGHRTAPYGAPPLSVSSGKAGSESSKQVLYWHDPMVPGQRFDKPGKSPFMDMDLVPVYADEEAAAGVKIDPAMAQNLGLRTAKASRQRFGFSIEAPATVGVPEGNDVLLQARTAGTIVSVHVSGNYATVRRGDPLLTITNPELLAALREYQVLNQSGSSDLAPLRQAAIRRLKVLGVDQASIEKAEQGLAPDLTLVQHAPASGIVRELGAREGMTVAPGQMLARISPLSPIWIEAALPESSTGSIHPGDTASVLAPGLMDMPITAKVVAVLPAVDPVTRTRGVRLEASNRDLTLVPGMTARVVFEEGAGEQVLAVPDEAIIRTGTRTLVYAQNDAGRFVPLEIDAGRTINGQTEVRSGLMEGATVVSSAQFLIDSESNLRAAGKRVQTPTRPDPIPAAKVGYEGNGVVTGLTADAVTLRHEPVAALDWPAMTMTFALAPDIKTTVPLGTAVRFRFKMDAGKSPTVTWLEPVAGPAGVGDEP
ncbi:efflux RND transporter periplasmic adaptor subunit [Emcibacter sp. SYSU 3D8]|uniref:efflux RND transporter periplasmic adaptor subunit n=1 Tax=Emcibacter sp. SYSU 3D8 TaxID=3133969 RepID=UPI0031FF22B9